MFNALLEDVLYKESPDDSQVPYVDNKDADAVNSVEDTGLVNKIQNKLDVYPRDNQNPHKERDDVDVRVDPELQGERVGVGDDVEDPGLVRHGVQLGGEAKHGPTHGPQLIWIL